jgi:hypothetical protein
MTNKNSKVVKAVVSEDGKGIFKGARQSPSTPSAYIEISTPKPAPKKK